MAKNMIVTKKLMMTNIIENFIADNIVFGMKVLAHHPEELSLEIWEFTNFDRRFTGPYFDMFVSYFYLFIIIQVREI